MKYWQPWQQDIRELEGEVDRERQLGQGGATIWLTGLSGSGKSTLAHTVEERLH